MSWKWNTEISHLFKSILCRSNFGGDYSCESFWYVCISFAHLDLGIFSRSLQIFSSSVRLDEEWWWATLFKSFSWFSMGFKSGLWLGHTRTFTFMFWSHSRIALAVCLESVSCWNVKSSHQSKVICILKQLLIKNLPVFASIHCLLYPYQSPSPRLWNASS